MSKSESVRIVFRFSCFKKIATGNYLFEQEWKCTEYEDLNLAPFRCYLETTHDMHGWLCLVPAEGLELMSFRTIALARFPFWCTFACAGFFRSDEWLHLRRLLLSLWWG